MPWVVVATAPHQLTAELWQQYLSDQDIPSMIEAQDAVSFLGLTPFPVRLRVPEEHADSARELLEALLRTLPELSMRLQIRFEIIEGVGDLLSHYTQAQRNPNPNVQEPVRRRLQGLGAVHLLEPLAYVPFVDLMRRAYLLLTDSGGIQEEGPSLGKPVLVMREKTERPEAVTAGTVRLVGADPERIIEETFLLLDNEEEHRHRSRIHNPYGDGQASGRIVRRIATELC